MEIINIIIPNALYFLRPLHFEGEVVPISILSDLFFLMRKYQTATKTSIKMNANTPII